jgi:uncharacterized protein
MMRIFPSRRRQATVSATVSVFFATDLHGSDHCFRKFLSAVSVYEADVLILGGDMTGKLAVPIVKTREGRCELYEPGGVKEVATSRLEEVRGQLCKAGYYPFVVETPEEVDGFLSDRRRVDAKVHELMVERLVQWSQWADRKLDGTEIEILVAPGNDDPVEIDGVLRDLPRFRLVEDEVVSDAIPGLEIELLSTGVSNPTPWKTHREMEETALKDRLENLAAQLQRPEHAIFNIHVPPYGSGLDNGPIIDPETLKSTGGFGHTASTPVGSTAVREFIERYQPQLSLHGHIHESRGSCTIGRTVSINPGSDYGDGVLRGAFIRLSADGIENSQLTSG